MRATLAFNGLSSISPEILRKPLVNIPLIETIDPCVENLYRNQVHVGKLLEMKMLESFFTFDQKYCKLCDGFAIGSPLGSTSANVLMCHFEKICLENYPFQFKAVAYRRYVDDMILLFRSGEHVKTFQKYLNKQHNILFTSTIEETGSLSFLDININRVNSKFITSVCRKPIFIGVFTKFKSFVSKSYK